MPEIKYLVPGNFHLRALKSSLTRGGLAVLLLMLCFTLSAATLVPDPKFTQLSTEQDLSQDTVHAVLLDHEGFLWLGTAGGLNRYDGYQVDIIGGANNEIRDSEIYALFEDDQHRLWISTATRGIFLLDLATTEIRRVGDWKIPDQPDWFQSADEILQDTDGRVWLALADKVVSLHPDTLEATVEFALPEEMITVEHAIRTLWVEQDFFLVGASEGLFVIDRSEGSAEILPFSPENATDDTLNVKFLNTFGTNQLFIGTVEGLFSLAVDTIRSYLQNKDISVAATQRVGALNIWHMAPDQRGGYYIGTNDGLYSFHPSGDQLQHMFQLTDSRYYITDNNVISFIGDRAGNLWLGTRYDGALYWTPDSTRFTNLINLSGAERILSNTYISSFWESPDQQLWIGTENGLTHYDLTTGDSQFFLENMDEKAVYSFSTIYQVVAAGDNRLLLDTAEGFRFFDTELKTSSPPVTDDAQSNAVLNGFFWGVAQDGNNQVWFITEDSFYRFDPETGDLARSEALAANLLPTEVESFIPHPSDPDSILLSMVGKLYQFNTQNQQLTLIHALPKQGNLHLVAPDSMLEDDTGTMWITYPGVGLIGVNTETAEQQYFIDKRGALPTNYVYGLMKDAAGDLWMSSHRGVLRFLPENQHVQVFAYEEGLSVIEFNQGAHIRLSDGRMLYGGQKGAVLFDPAAFAERQVRAKKVRITGIKLSTRELANPWQDLDGTEVTMDHQDVGLQVQFSTLEYDHQKGTRYQYKLSGKDNITYPMSREASVMFPKLEPGTYRFEVVALDPGSGEKSAPATMTIVSRHAPWASPLAYAFYLLVLLSALALLWYRRARQARRLLAAHQEVLQNKNRLSMAMTASNSNVWEWDASEGTFYAPRMTDELGHTEHGNTIEYQTQLALIHPQDRGLFESRWQEFIADQDPGFDVTYRMQAANGDWQWYRDVGSAIRDHLDPSKVVIAGTYTNITENLATREKVRLFGEAFRYTRDWVCILNAECAPVAANQAFCDAFGVDENGDLSAQINQIWHIDSTQRPRFWKKLQELDVADHWSGEEELAVASGQLRNVLINVTSVASVRVSGEIDYYLVIMSDVTEQKGAEDELRRLANFDSLTNLPNRTLLLDRITHGIEHARRSQDSVGLFFIDLDRFKQVNDSLGHNAGDELLRVVSQRLVNLVREEDTVARLGGDEFVVMVEHVTDAGKLSVLARQLISTLEQPVQLGNQTVSVSSSIGIALFPVDASDSEELVRNADIAMYHAKEMGRNNFQYFTEEMNQLAQARLGLETRVKRAHQDKEFVNYYQPIVNSASGLAEGFELLMRWPSDTGMIPPDIFIPVAEELGLIEDMTWDALERAMPTLKRWQQHNRSVYLSVNLSARHFERGISVEHVINLLQRFDVPVQALRFEITESALMRDYERSLSFMQAMREKGFVIALDDFGTGYSSLKYLKEFPIQVLKIDKSFVNDIGKGASGEAIVITTLRMAESLGMYCVAEGIEEAAQIRFFSKHGCERLQGYYFSKPVAESDTDALVTRSWRDESAVS